METTLEKPTETKPKTFLPKFLDRANDVSGFASESLESLTGVHITEEYIEASDGRILIRIEHFKQAPDSIRSYGGQSDELKDCIIPAKELHDVVGGLEECEAVRVSTKDEFAQLATNRSMTVVETIQENYPNTKVVIPEAKAVFRILLSPVILGKLTDWATAQYSKSLTDGILFEFTGELDGVRFEMKLPDGRRAYGVLMPMRAVDSKL